MFTVPIGDLERERGVLLSILSSIGMIVTMNIGSFFPAEI